MTTGRVIGLSVNNYNDNLTNATISFTLNAHSSGDVSIYSVSGYTFGYGIIEWTQDGNNAQGLLAHMVTTYTYSTGNTRYSVPINNGLPF